MDHKDCNHDKIDIVGGGGDMYGTWETFRCRVCGWEFDIRVIDDE